MKDFKTTKELEKELERQKSFAKSREDMIKEGDKRKLLSKQIKIQKLRNKYPKIYEASKRMVSIGNFIGKGVNKMSKNLAENQDKKRKKKDSQYKKKKERSFDDVANIIP